MQYDLQRLVDEHVGGDPSVPGAAVAAFVAGTTIEASAGVASTVEAVPFSTDTLVSIGSISKLYTAATIFQLRDAGLLDLGADWRTYVDLPRMPDVPASLRQLLSHTSGLPDVPLLRRTPERERADALATAAGFLELCASGSDPVGPPGDFSYSSFGYVILGRIVEEVTGRPWQDQLATSLAGPLGLERTFARPEAALGLRGAPGHALTGMGEMRPAGLRLHRGFASAGGVLASVADLARFGRALAGAGPPLLGAASHAEMRERVATYRSGFTHGEGHGLGWWLPGWGTPALVGHRGAGPATFAILVCDPPSGFVLAAAGNSSNAEETIRNVVVPEVFRWVFGAEVPELAVPDPDPEGVPAHLDAYAGTYANGRRYHVVKVADGGLLLERRNGVHGADGSELVGKSFFRPHSRDVFVGTRSYCRFGSFDRAGRPQALHFASRWAPRVGAA